MKYLFLQLVFLLAFTACVHSSDDDHAGLVTRYTHMLGETPLPVKLTRFGTGGPVFIRLHDNEVTAEKAVTSVLKDNRGTFLEIENNMERTIRFRLKGRSYRFDPNRIFTENGRIATLKVFHNYSEAAEHELNQFADFITGMIPEGTPVIAVHNNSNKAYSIDRYIYGNLKQDAQTVHRNPDADEDDFVFTTSETVFRNLKKKNISVVLQDNETVRDDGSLSVYYGRRGVPYSNIEAQFGHLEEQQKMIEELVM